MSVSPDSGSVRLLNLRGRIVAWARDTARRALIFVGRDVTACAWQRRALVIAPHPDDETLGCGARILLSSKRGIPVTVVIVTDGSAASQANGASQTELRMRRRNELEHAAHALGLPGHAVIALDYPDNAVAEHLDQIALDLRRVIDATAPDDVYVTCADELHPDHACCALAAADAVNQAATRPRLLEYPIWLWSDWPISRRHGVGAIVDLIWCLLRRSVEIVRVDSLAHEKRTALSKYRSQLGGDNLANGAARYQSNADAASLPVDVVRRALEGPELFFIRRHQRALKRRQGSN